MTFTGTTFTLVLIGVCAIVVAGVLFYRWLDKKDRERMGRK